MGKILKILIALAAIAATSACSNGGCLENRSSVPLAGFYSSDGKKVSLDALQITGIGAPHDSVLLAAGKPVSEVYLPMRSTTDNVSWKLAYKWPELDFEAFCDTITFSYSSQVYFASEECGVVYHYYINDVAYTTHLLDSVVVTDPLVTNIDTERIKIYFRTDENP